jgi:hypothetical protein
LVVVDVKGSCSALSLREVVLREVDTVGLICKLDVKASGTRWQPQSALGRCSNIAPGRQCGYRCPTPTLAVPVSVAAPSASLAPPPLTTAVSRSAPRICSTEVPERRVTVDSLLESISSAPITRAEPWTSDTTPFAMSDACGGNSNFNSLPGRTPSSEPSGMTT